MSLRQVLTVSLCLHFISCAPRSGGSSHHKSHDSKKETTTRTPSVTTKPSIPATGEEIPEITQDDFQGVWRNTSSFELDYTGFHLDFYKQVKVLPQSEISKCPNFIPIPGLSIILTEIEISQTTYKASLYQYKGSNPDAPETASLCLWQQKAGEFSFIEKLNLIGIGGDYVKVESMDEDRMTLDMTAYDAHGTLKN